MVPTFVTLFLQNCFKGSFLKLLCFTVTRMCILKNNDMGGMNNFPADARLYNIYFVYTM